MLRVMQLKARRNRRGFTLIELLVVVLILAVLMAVSIPLYLSAVADAQKKTCRANMQTIANAVQAARVQNPNLANYSTFFAAVSTVLEPDLTSAPICPLAGSYTVEAGVGATSATYRVKCTATGHGTFEPGVDSN